MCEKLDGRSDPFPGGRGPRFWKHGDVAAVGLISDAGLQATPTFFYSVRHMNHRVVVGEPVHGYLWSSIV